jgi:hypothetical protein
LPVFSADSWELRASGVDEALFSRFNRSPIEQIDMRTQGNSEN